MRKCSRLAAQVLQLNDQVGFIVMLVGSGIVMLVDSPILMLLGVCVAWGGCGNSFAEQVLYITGGSKGATTCCLVFAADCCLSVLAAGCCLSVLAADCCLVAVVAAATVCR